MSVALGFEECRVRDLLIALLECNSLLDFLQLIENQLVVGISISVVLGQYLVGFSIPSFCNKPTRTLGDEGKRDEDVKRNGDLEQHSSLPTPVSLHVQASECKPGSHDGAHEEASLDEGSRLSAVARVCNLGSVCRTCNGRDAYAETEEESSTEHVPTSHCECLHECTDNLEEVPNR